GEREGSLVTNPGGPGGSGVNFLESVPMMISAEVSQSYDVVGFDPRGVDRSAGVECLSDEETDEYLAATAEPGSTEAEELSEEWAIRVAEACEAHSGAVLRGARGSGDRAYPGSSYATYLGASYAELYPDRVGRFVLDGAMDPSLTMNETAAGQAEGFEDAVDAFLSDCLGKEDCPFTGTEEEAKQQLNAFFSSLDESPLDSG